MPVFSKIKSDMQSKTQDIICLKVVPMIGKRH